LTWQLDAKNLWWDESLSLQRAEADLWTLLRGLLVMYDGLTSLPTVDQHPFFSFLLQGTLLRLADNNGEFILRFISVMAATILVPLAYTTVLYFVKRNVLPSTAQYWSALMAAISPFFLWYGQEARPYALWALLTLLSTYLLLWATDPMAKVTTLSKRRLVPYSLILICLITTHYYSLLLLPVHACLLYLYFYQQNRKSAIITAGILSAVGLLIGGLILWMKMSYGWGGNFQSVELDILFPDLLNAFSLGLSVDINKVWWLDVLYGLIALIGVLFAIRSKHTLKQQGWVIGAMMIVPMLALWLINLYQPAYMNARHLTLIGSGYLLALGSGLGLLWHYQKWLTGLVVSIMITGAGYSTFNYFTQEESAKDDYTSLGQYLDGRLMAGDVVLLRPPFSWRIFRYYLPIEAIDQANRAGLDIAHYGMPLLGGDWENTYRQLDTLTQQYQRIWLITSGTHPYDDLEDQVGRWLDEHTYRLREIEFFSRSSLKARLYLPTVPVFNEPLQDIETPLVAPFSHPEKLHTVQPTTTLTTTLSASAVTGQSSDGELQLVGYHIGEYGAPNIAMPVTLYWQAVQETDIRYKYILQLVERANDNSYTVLATTEREPYDGAISTNLWAAGQQIREYSEIPPVDWQHISSEKHWLRLQVYRADTQEKLLIINNLDLSQQTQIDPDQQTLWIPLHEPDIR